MQSLGVLVSIVLVVALSMKKISIGKVMAIATAVVALTSGKSFTSIATTIYRSFVDKATLELAASVLSIGIFSTIMQATGALDLTVKGLEKFLGSVKAAIMAVPALVGSMPVLGGAAVSAPLVDKLGDSLDMSPDLKAAANLVFRHGMFFVFPFGPGLILASKLTGLSVQAIISRLWPMSLVLWGVGYLTLLRNLPSASAGATSSADRIQGGIEFLRSGAPLLLALTLSLVFKIPLYAALIAGTSLALIQARRNQRPMPTKTVLIKGANFNQVFAMFWIMAFKQFLTDSGVFTSLIQGAKDMGVPAAVITALLPLLFGYGSASQTTTLGVLLPVLVVPISSLTHRLWATCLVYSMSFIAYFASPLHLCQVLTCEYFKVDIPAVYKLYWKVVAAIALSAITYVILAAPGL